MKKIKFLPYFGLLSCLLLFACGKDKVQVDIPKQSESKPVVFAFISPDQEDTRVSLSLSTPYFGNTFDPNLTVGELSIARVSISDGSSSVILPWNTKLKQYAISATTCPIVVGKTYSLLLDIPGYGKLSAQTTIPAPIEDPKLELIELNKDVTSNLSAKGSNREDRFLYRFTMKDMLEGSSCRLYASMEQLGAPQGSSGFSDRAYANPCYGDPLLFEFNGTSSSISKVLPLYKKYSYNGPNATSQLKHTGYFISGSRDYIEFYRTLAPNMGKSDIFGTEPGSVYSNIEGGYGVFAGYNCVVSTSSTIYGN